MAGLERDARTYHDTRNLSTEADDSRVRDGLVRYFGQEFRDVPVGPHENANVDMFVGDDVFNKRSKLIEDTIIVGSGRDLSALVTVVAPTSWNTYKKWERTVLKINVTAATRVPQRAPPTENSIKAFVRKGKKERIGKKWSMEVDYIGTPMGDRIHAGLVQAAKMSIMRTAEMLTVEALYSAPDHARETFTEFKEINISVDKQVEREIDLFASLARQKDQEKFIVEYQRQRKAIRAKGGEITAIITSSAVVTHLDLSEAQDTKYVGFKNNKLVTMIGPRLPTTFNGTVAVVEIPEFQPDDDDLPVDYTVRTISFSSYHPMIWQKIRASKYWSPADWRTSARDITIYDLEDQKNQVAVSIQDALHHAYLFDTEGNPRCEAYLDHLKTNPRNEEFLAADDGSPHTRPARFVMTRKEEDGTMVTVKNLGGFDLNKMPNYAMANTAECMAAMMRRSHKDIDRTIAAATEALA